MCVWGGGQSYESLIGCTPNAQNYGHMYMYIYMTLCLHVHVYIYICTMHVDHLLRYGRYM